MQSHSHNSIMDRSNSGENPSSNNPTNQDSEQNDANDTPWQNGIDITPSSSQHQPNEFQQQNEQQAQYGRQQQQEYQFQRQQESTSSFRSGGMSLPAVAEETTSANLLDLNSETSNSSSLPVAANSSSSMTSIASSLPPATPATPDASQSGQEFMPQANNTLLQEYIDSYAALVGDWQAQDSNYDEQLNTDSATTGTLQSNNYADSTLNYGNNPDSYPNDGQQMLESFPNLIEPQHPPAYESALNESEYLADSTLCNQEDSAGNDQAEQFTSFFTQQPPVNQEAEVEQSHEQEKPILTKILDEDEEEKEFFSRQRGVAEHGSFKRNFRETKHKLDHSQSFKETTTSFQTGKQDTSHADQLADVEAKVGELSLIQNNPTDSADPTATNDTKNDEDDNVGGLPKFKRTLSVSFNVRASGRGRNSVDIRNLPSYLHNKRASIIDVAKGAMSSLFGNQSTASNTAGSDIQEQETDDEPIFEEPIAPTLSLGQRVAMVQNNGSEFGTVGWIGRFADYDNDWMVGVVFDNKIGNSDGMYNGTRYFYARENYAMFVPLSVLTKTDNYIGRPETGTMLSRMSIQLKPGQLISIQRSSIRLQHCFLNAPHQRVGHDVRAVSNRLHCQCHNCGPCAHLTKQGRGVNALAAINPHGGHHAHGGRHGSHSGHGQKKHINKNSLSQAAVEILSHHHHHLEESHEEPEYRFGDNSAHACNFVRYSCCVQAQSSNHQPSGDCSMIRPEILDNLITAPRAPVKKLGGRRARRAARNNKSSFEYNSCSTKTQTITTTLTYDAQQQQSADIFAVPSDNSNFVVNDIIQSDANISNTNINADDQLVSNWLEHSASALAQEPAYHNRFDEDMSPTRRSCSTCSSLYTGSSGSSSSYNSQEELDEYYNDGTVKSRRRRSYKEQVNGANSTLSTIDTQMSIADQRRFIFRHESSSSTNRALGRSNRIRRRSKGLMVRMRSCIRCLIGRGQSTCYSTNRFERSLEYRRRNSTFVPSTLAKPEDDFASQDKLKCPLLI